MQAGGLGHSRPNIASSPACELLRSTQARSGARARPRLQDVMLDCVTTNASRTPDRTVMPCSPAGLHTARLGPLTSLRWPPMRHPHATIDVYALAAPPLGGSSLIPRQRRLRDGTPDPDWQEIGVALASPESSVTVSRSVAVSRLIMSIVSDEPGIRRPAGGAGAVARTSRRRLARGRRTGPRRWWARLPRNRRTPPAWLRESPVPPS